jgi:hypothetical protein
MSGSIHGSSITDRAIQGRYMNPKLLRALLVLSLALVARASFGQTSKPFVPPRAPANEDPAALPCNVQPLPLNIDRIKSAQGVRSVVSDEKRLTAFVLFESGDVLKILSNACYARSMEARLWTGPILYLDRDIVKKAELVTDMIFDAPEAKDIKQSMDKQRFDSKFDQVRHMSAQTYLLSVTTMPLGGADTLLKIEYLTSPTTGDK